MAALYGIFLNIILPIFIVVGFSVLVDRKFEIETKSVSRLTMYLFSPFLVFMGLFESSIKITEVGAIGLFGLVSSLVLALVAWGVCRLLKYDRALQSAFIMCACTVNAGNYGIPLNNFAYGEEGLARALIYFPISALFINTVGVYIASRGNASTRDSFLNVLKVPLPYAAVLGIIANVYDLRLPLALERAFNLLAQASVPAMLVILGLQLSRSRVRGKLVAIGLAVVIKLVAAPAIGIAMAPLFGLEGVSHHVSIVESSMPTAVMATILATEFEGDAEFVSSTVVVSTLASIVSLGLLLSFLGTP